MTHLRHTADRTGTVRTPDGADLRFNSRGPQSAGCTVVLAHGWTMTSDSWAAQASRLVAGSDGAVSVVRWDQRGHGGSGRGTAPITMDLLAADLAHVIEASVPEDRPVVLGGHSMGGMAVTALAAARPDLFGDRVRGVLLAAASAGGLDTTGPGFPIAARVSGGAFKSAMWALRTAPGPVDVLHGLASPTWPAYCGALRRAVFGPDAPRAQVAACAHQVHAAPAAVIAECHAAMMRHHTADRLGALGRDGVGVVVLSGGRDRMITRRHARALAAALPRARTATAPRAGHMVPVEAPETTSRLLAGLCGVELSPP